LERELEQLFRSAPPAEVHGFYVNRRNVFQGKWIRHGAYYPVRMLKLVRRNLVTFDEHEFDYRAYVPGRTLTLTHDIVEENLKENDITWWTDKHNRFAVKAANEEILRADLRAEWKVTPHFFGNSDERILWLKSRWYQLPLYVRPFLYFTYRYFLRVGFLDGKKGFIFHFLHAFWYRLLIDINIDQIRRGEKTAET
jgi:hypothetical protein